MNIYKYHHQTKEFLPNSKDVSGGYGALIDPLETKKAKKNIFLVPANALTKKPMPAGTNQIQCANGKAWVLKDDFRGDTTHDENGDVIVIQDIGLKEPSVSKNEIACLVDGAFVVKKDYRGEKLFNKESGHKVLIDVVGVEPDNTMTTKEPPDDTSSWNETTSKWVKDAAKVKTKNNNVVAADIKKTDADVFSVLEDLISVLAVRGDLSTESQAVLDLRDNLKAQLQ